MAVRALDYSKARLGFAGLRCWWIFLFLILCKVACSPATLLAQEKPEKGDQGAGIYFNADHMHASSNHGLHCFGHVALPELARVKT